MIFISKEKKKERTRKENDSYFGEGKSHSNCSDNNEMVPEPLPNSIQTASDIDFILQSQTLSKRAKPSLLLICGNCPVLEIWNHVYHVIISHLVFRTCSSNIFTYLLKPMDTTFMSLHKLETFDLVTLNLLNTLKIKVVNMWKWNRSRHTCIVMQ